MAILILKSRLQKKDKEEHYIIIKRAICLQDLTIPTIPEAKTDRNVRRHRQFHGYIWKFQYFTLTI